MIVKRNVEEIKKTLFIKQNKRCYYTKALIKEKDLGSKTHIDHIERKNNEEGEAVLAINNVRALANITGPILSKKLNIFFCHIPKNGGSSLRKYLDPIDEKYLNEETRKTIFSQLIDINHLPLFFIENNLPDLYEFILQAESYAIIRNPYERFVSSMAQRTRMYKNIELGDLNTDEIEQELENTMSYLKTKTDPNSFLSHDYIHFQRQSDYIYYQDKQCVKNLYLMNEIETLMQDLIHKFPNSELMYRASYKRIGATMIPKNNISTVIMKIYTSSKSLKFLPKPLIEIVKKILFKDFKHSNLNSIFLSDTVKSFVEEYYNSDIKLYNRVIQDRAKLIH